MLNQPIQILLVIVVSALTVVLVFIGVQVFLILKEVQRSIKKVNEILSNASSISESIAGPFSNFSETVSNLSGIGSALKFLFKKRKKKEKEEK